MHLNATTLANDIVTAMDAAFPVPADQNDTPDATRLAAAKVLATAVVNHIKNNANVTGVCPPGGGPLSGGTIL